MFQVVNDALMSIEEEVRRGYTIPTEMKKVWKVQMDLLRKLLAVCEKHHLKIWAEGGTLLGTIREHGYIPWDDDIDMAMLRDDFDRLVQIAPEEFSHPFFFQYGYTEDYYPLGYAKIRMDNTTAIEPERKFAQIHQGIFVDIFPLDGLPDNQNELSSLIAERNKYYSSIVGCSTPLSLSHPGRSFRTLISRPRYKNLFSKLENVFRGNSINDNEYVSCLSFIVDERYFRKKEWYKNTVFMPFEDIMIPVPEGYHFILEKQYGDYMTPRNSPGFHTFWKLDADTSYKEYLHDLYSFLKVKQ